MLFICAGLEGTVANQAKLDFVNEIVQAGAGMLVRLRHIVEHAETKGATRR